MNDRQKMVDSLACPECGNKVACKMDCGRAESFRAFKSILIWMPRLTNEQLAELNFNCWVEAQERAGQQIVDEVESVLKGE